MNEYIWARPATEGVPIRLIYGIQEFKFVPKDKATRINQTAAQSSLEPLLGRGIEAKAEEDTELPATQRDRWILRANSGVERYTAWINARELANHEWSPVFELRPDFDNGTEIIEVRVRGRSEVIATLLFNHRFPVVLCRFQSKVQHRELTERFPIEGSSLGTGDLGMLFSDRLYQIFQEHYPHK